MSYSNVRNGPNTTGGPTYLYRVAQKLHISICLMLNWYDFVKYQPNFITFDWEEDILNIACKLISTILYDWHYLVACQHNSWGNFILI